MEITSLPLVICLIFIILPPEKVACVYLAHRFQTLNLAMAWFTEVRVLYYTHVHEYGTWKYLWTSLLPVTSDNTSNSHNSLFLLEEDIVRLWAARTFPQSLFTKAVSIF